MGQFATRKQRAAAVESARKRRTDYAIAGATTAFAILAIYGSAAWYFPDPDSSPLLAAPLVILGLYFAYVYFRKAPAVLPASAGTSPRKPFVIAMIPIMVPLALWCALGMGIPALIMRIQGPNQHMIATIGSKRYHATQCRYELQLNELSFFLRTNLCVDAGLFDAVAEGDRVSLEIRRNYFGTRVFSIRKSRILSAPVQP